MLRAVASFYKSDKRI